MKEYKSFLTYLKAKLRQARKIEDVSLRKTIEILLEEIINNYQNVYNKPVEIELEGWKGVGNISIYENFNTDFTVIEYFKDKETGEVREVKTIVPHENVNKMLEIVRSLDFNTEYKCYAIARKLGWDWKELWKERKKYFELYYYPIKVLEKLGIIKYYGRGSIERIK